MSHLPFRMVTKGEIGLVKSDKSEVKSAGSSSFSIEALNPRGKLKKKTRNPPIISGLLQNDPFPGFFNQQGRGRSVSVGKVQVKQYERTRSEEDDRAGGGVVDPATILEIFELQIAKVKEEAFGRKEILEKVDKWLVACEEQS